MLYVQLQQESLAAHVGSDQDHITCALHSTTIVGALSSVLYEWAFTCNIWLQRQTVAFCSGLDCTASPVQMQRHRAGSIPVVTCTESRSLHTGQ
jgi:hypothetical protein